MNFTTIYRALNSSKAHIWGISSWKDSSQTAHRIFIPAEKIIPFILSRKAISVRLVCELPNDRLEYLEIETAKLILKQ